MVYRVKNVEWRCQLTWILWTLFTEKDLEELKQSYENRIERLKHEAEATVASAMAETDKVVASVKSLYENEVDMNINLCSQFRIEVTGDMTLKRKANTF